MSNETFVLALTAGAGLLAIWVYAAFPGSRPLIGLKTCSHRGGLRRLQLTPGLIGSAPAVFALVFMFVLPALVYALLCTLWVLKHAQSALGVSR